MTVSSARAPTHTHTHTRAHRQQRSYFFFRIVPRGGSTKTHQNTKMKPITFEFVCASSQFNLRNDTFRFASHQQRMFSRVQTIYLIIILVICITGKSQRQKLPRLLTSCLCGTVRREFPLLRFQGIYGNVSFNWLQVRHKISLLKIRSTSSENPFKAELDVELT